MFESSEYWIFYPSCSENHSSEVNSELYPPKTGEETAMLLASTLLPEIAAKTYTKENHWHLLCYPASINKRNYVVEWLRSEGSFKIIWFQSPCHGFTGQVAQVPIPPSFEHLQGWGTQSSGQQCQGLTIL